MKFISIAVSLFAATIASSASEVKEASGQFMNLIASESLSGSAISDDDVTDRVATSFLNPEARRFILENLDGELFSSLSAEDRASIMVAVDKAESINEAFEVCSVKADTKLKRRGFDYPVKPFAERKCFEDVLDIGVDQAANVLAAPIILLKPVIRGLDKPVRFLLWVALSPFNLAGRVIRKVIFDSDSEWKKVHD